MKEPCLYILVKSFDNAYDYVVSKLGNDISKWRYGDMHNVLYKHSFFSQTPLRSIFDRSMPFGGNGRTVNFAGSRSEDGSYDAIAAPGYRLLGSWAPGSKVNVHIDTGMSENIMSPHYFDLHELYAKHEFVEWGSNYD